ncbi:DUF2357 domain-containing protein [Caballeronia sp. SBC2]|uniref:DUF2357 domain-containing protein n=1 Tax=Caballeronia sp. SBC2 TaxID=2705547 RepID=UPI0013E0EDC2|nr:DUF2357 domain-containing protein [Caballeronia sp. SBC2]QIE30325.1 hypothetical protein SBC2_84020 [Caballeronia sp. SBC2]
MPLLFQAEGDGWRLEVVGKLPRLPPFLSTAPTSAIATVGVEKIECINEQRDGLREIASDEAMEPLFFENVAYDIHFEKSHSKVTLTLPPGAEQRRIREHTEHHYINFGNNVGFADFVIGTAGGTANIRIEVFSRKADYRTDYIVMRDEVSAMLCNLAMAPNSKTYGRAAPERGGNPTLAEWFSLLCGHFEEFSKLAQAIAKNPHSRLVVKSSQTDTERARRVSRQVIDRALRRPNNGPLLPTLGVALPRRIHESISASTFDIPENRYFKGLLETTYRNILALCKFNESGDEDADRSSEKKFFSSIRPKLKEMQRRIEAVMREPFLSQVGDGTLERPKSMVLHKHTLYSRFDKLCQLLNSGLSFAGEILPIGVKQTSLLYEYWCFLKIVDLLRERFDLEEQSVVKIKRLRTTVALEKGKASAMRFKHKPTGKPLYVVYNRLFNKLPTIAQQPDNVIQFASDERFYIFDAKYRIQFDDEYVKHYGGPGPTEEDVNTMHRYRDAIAIPHPMNPNEYRKGTVTGAVVLFPYPDEAAYVGHRFHKSIEQVEIGGLPFLPNKTTLMAAKLNELLYEEFSE